MNVTEALKALNEGKKIRRVSWGTNKAYGIEKEESISFGGKFKKCIYLTYKDLQADDWEVVDRKNILSKKEKEYLENILNPYLDSYEFTFEKESKSKNDFLKITIYPYGGYKEINHIYLPLYEAREPMFENLEKGKTYMADDLNLFHE